ncbi:HNH endonuclease [Paenibacillus alkaliterrae]|uniref:HNH endonuclease n=1 Tax=Paenibacillus alkaliterrae TaxID=320909 RepID=UPI001F347DD3|nr:HNH endonuclease [Paenibacillus alkaliterrae]MCF2939030.1 HNH endonuclease [Paenibacillus alkaliterrae]
MKIEIRGRKKILVTECAYCGDDIEKPAYTRTLEAKRHFCDRSCNLKKMNEELNPTRMTFEMRMAVRRGHLGKGQGKAYPKILGRHAHRIAAEVKLGRALLPGEVVHHEDENRQNYSLENITILSSQKEHAKLHAAKNRGDAK